jgi:hypothetical protein
MACRAVPQIPAKAALMLNVVPAARDGAPHHRRARRPSRSRRGSRRSTAPGPISSCASSPSIRSPANSGNAPPCARTRPHRSRPRLQPRQAAAPPVGRARPRRLRPPVRRRPSRRPLAPRRRRPLHPASRAGRAGERSERMPGRGEQGPLRRAARLTRARQRHARSYPRRRRLARARGRQGRSQSRSLRFRRQDRARARFDRSGVLPKVAPGVAAAPKYLAVLLVSALTHQLACKVARLPARSSTNPAAASSISKRSTSSPTSRGATRSRAVLCDLRRRRHSLECRHDHARRLEGLIAFDANRAGAAKLPATGAAHGQEGRDTSESR